MVRAQRYTLVYARAVVKHLKSIDSKYDRLIRDAIEEQLQFQPGVATKNRKLLRQPAPFEAEWEIRFGPRNRFRVFYNIDENACNVRILAIGEKDGNRLIVGGEEVEL